MGFFDLNIPYDTSHKSSKTDRMKLVVKAMELGYSGVAYNQTMKGVMSDQNRCSISPFSLSSLLNLAPSLSSSIDFHRHLLGVPLHAPFRQYTRLTVSVESPGQGLVLNGGNPVLKTYDLVAVRPLNQSAFDHACQNAEVNIISIDFSDKLPFRLKLPMVKAAMERGVYFEITYSDLIVDVQVRRQMISNAKLLVDWTRGKNLIVSSGTVSVNDLRGPYDVANLCSLLGLSMERAKAALSKNCRNLITIALRKKHFYKEAIRVELKSSDGKCDSDKSISVDWLKWDPISSGEGDLQLNDIAKSFSATKVSKTVKAIDFSSVIDSIPSCDKSFLTGAGRLTIIGMSGKPDGNDLHGPSRNLLDNAPSKNQTSQLENSQELNLVINSTKTFDNTEEIRMCTNSIEEESKNLNMSDPLFSLTEVNVNTNGHDLQSEKHVCIEPVILLNENGSHQTSDMDVELNVACTAETTLHVLSKNIFPLAHHVEKSTSSQSSDVGLDTQRVTMDEDIVKMCTNEENIYRTGHGLGREQLAKSEHYTLVEHHPSTSQVEKSTNSQGSDLVIGIQNALRDEDIVKMCTKDTKNVSVKEQIEESRGSTLTVVESDSFVPTSDYMKVADVSLLANNQILDEVLIKKQDHVNADANAENFTVLDALHVKDNVNCVLGEMVKAEDKKHEEAHTESDQQNLVLSLSGMFQAENVSGQVQLEESRNCTPTVVEAIPFLPTADNMKIADVSLPANHEILDEAVIEKQEHRNADADDRNVIAVDDDLHVKDNENCVLMEEVTEDDQKHEEAHNGNDQQILVPSLSGKSKRTQRTSYQLHLFPLRRLLYPMSFKRKAKKFRSRLKIGN